MRSGLMYLGNMHSEKRHGPQKMKHNKLTSQKTGNTDLKWKQNKYFAMISPNQKSNGGLHLVPHIFTVALTVVQRFLNINKPQFGCNYGPHNKSD